MHVATLCFDPKFPTFYSLLESGVDGVRGQVSTILSPVIPMLKKKEFKGQQALLNGMKQTM